MHIPSVLESERLPDPTGKPVQLLGRVMMAAPATEYRWLDRFRQACEGDLQAVSRAAYPSAVTVHWVQSGATSRPFGVWEVGERLVIVVPVDASRVRSDDEELRSGLAQWILAVERRRGARARAVVDTDEAALVARWCARRVVVLREDDGGYRPIAPAAPGDGCRAPPSLVDGATLLSWAAPAARASG